MQRLLLGFCGGAAALALPWPGPPWLPAGLAGISSVALLGLLIRASIRRPARCGRLLPVVGACLGLGWSGLCHDAALRARLVDDGNGARLQVTGRIVDDPAVTGVGLDGLPVRRFQALIMERGAGEALPVVGARVRLTWYGAPEIARGEVWRWTAVLRGPWSYANPGGFDYERWLLGSGLQGTGYVREGQRLSSASPGPVDRARRTLVERVNALKLDNVGVLLALLVGDAGGIPDSQWETFRVTGTVHLMVISGLHVSLASTLGFLIGRLAVRLVPLLPLWLDARRAGCLSGAAVAVVYVVLAGAGLPALRALVMSAAALTLLANGRTGRLGSALLMALAVLLLLQPLAIHQRGFWLSFGAVAILYLALGHRYGTTRWQTLLRAQGAMSLAMLPLVILSTGTLPWTSMPANLLAVPVMSLVVVPAVLLGGCLMSLAPVPAVWALQAADLATTAVLWWLEWLARAPLPTVAGSILAAVLSQAAALCWLLGVPRVHAPALMLGAVLPLAAVPAGVRYGEYRVMALDVGQGSAIVIDTARHRLLYDTGPGFPSGFETGSSVVVPSLAATGPTRLDALVLSHDDVDHVGGAAAVQARAEPARIFVSTPAEPPQGLAAPENSVGTADDRVASCHGRRWRWDGVTLQLLEVDRPADPADNDRSCILLVDDGGYRTLMAGDIGTKVEAALLRELAETAQVPVELMFAPHHGSRTSSSTALVRVLDPNLVLVNAGRGNRFGHPHPEVVARYRQVGARIFQTGREGALVWRSGAPERLIRWRRDRAPYWRSGEPDGASSRR